MIVIKRTLEYRVNKILEDYDITSIEFKNALERINRKLGGERYKKVLELLELKDSKQVISILLNNYYDKLYSHSIDENKNFMAIIESDDDDVIIKEIKSLC